MVALNQPRIIPYCDYRNFGVCPVLLDCLECLDFVLAKHVFLKSKFPTHSYGIWGLVCRIPKGFFIWTRFKGCTRPSKI